jgi:hypothetical protein
MAELKPLGRQFSQPNAPDISGASEAIGRLGQTAQGVASTISAYVDSANKVEAELQYTEATNILNKELVTALSQENLAQGDAYARYRASAEAVKEGILPHVGKKYQSDVKNLIDKQINNLSLKVASQELSFKEAESKAAGQAILMQQYKDLDEAASTGDIEALQNNEELIESTIGNLKNIGAFDAVDEFKAKDAIQKTKNKALYSAQYERLLREDPIEADKLLREIGETKPANLTHEEWQDVQASLLQQRSAYLKAIDDANTLGKDEYSLAVAQGQIQTDEQLNTFIAMKEAEGRYFSPNDRLKMKEALVNAQKTKLKGQEQILEIDNAVNNNPDALYDFSKGSITKWYAAKSNFLEEQYAQQKALNPDAQVPSRLAIRASVASKVPFAVAAFNNEFADKLRYGTPDDFEEAVKVGTQLEEVSPKTYANLDKETQVYQQTASNLYGNTKLPLEQIRDLTAKAAAPKDSATQERIDKGLAAIHKTAYLKDLYKEVYGTKFVNPALQPQFNSLTRIYDSFYQMSGDKDIAKKLTVNTMRVNSGKSEFIPKYDVTKNPIEQTELYKTHPTLVKNQIALGALEIIKNNQEARAAGIKTQFTIEWPDDLEVPNLNEINDKTLNDQSLFRDHKGKERVPQLKINGKNRKLFLMNPNTDLEDPSVDQRQYYFEDEYGNPWPIYITTAKQHGNIIKSDSGIASIQFRSLKDLLPDVAAEEDARVIEDQALKHLREEFKAKNKPKISKPETEDDAMKKRRLPENVAAMTGMPERPNPLANISNLKAKLKAEEEYIGKELPGKVNQIKAAKQNKFEKINND